MDCALPGKCVLAEPTLVFGPSTQTAGWLGKLKLLFTWALFLMLDLMPVVIQESKSGSHELSHIISATFYWTKQEKVEKIVSAS